MKDKKWYSFRFRGKTFKYCLIYLLEDKKNFVVICLDHHRISFPLGSKRIKKMAGELITYVKGYVKGLKYY